MPERSTATLTPLATPEPAVSFDSQGFFAGARAIIPIALGDAVYGLVFGVLAGQVHLSVLEVLLMSGLVFAGSSQLIVLSLWTLPLPVAAIILTTLIVNARSILMGAAISPWFLRLSPFKAYATLFFLTDENWALTMSKFDAGQNNAAFLLGSGLMLYLFWTTSTVIGRTVGNMIVQDPARWGLDFAFTAVFLALLVPLWKGKSYLVPWLVAAGVAVLAAHFLPGKWYILLGGLAGSIVGVLRHAD
ncbi:AzlC family ABC transporter permease [Dictyobacter kobayashii]|uniref:Branched-chain amino acid ABC transporter permease n=1 Tax=Dictyobacter kobayashii TaxID=2014872 RepID=A0A402AYU3_9CHLR|nr:AzlC family ABC transporter permease [Dictyobacter kobayashii]GCE24272.1 branched-chain amino acid ABC transporter permease [Dictyobacter kobayashii]